MLKPITPVPKDKSPLKVLSEMGDKTANAWIFFHRNVIENLRNSAVPDGFGCIMTMHWEETAEHLDTLIWVPNSGEEWVKVLRIKSDNIAFKYEPSDPEHLFFLKMEE